MVNPVHFKRKLRLREKFLSSVFCGAEKLHFRFDATEKCVFRREVFRGTHARGLPCRRCSCLDTFGGMVREASLESGA